MARAASEAHLHQSRNPPGRRRPGSRRMSFVERTGLDRFNPAQGGVRGMRVIAGGLLVAMAGLFLFARMREGEHPVWGFLRAFAEAAMVAVLADWFAVTALFRHPLGMPIPHPAIIQRNKIRNGARLSTSLQSHLLNTPVVLRREESGNRTEK